MSFRDSILSQLARMEQTATVRDDERIVPTRFDPVSEWRLVSMPFTCILTPLVHALDTLNDRTICTSLPPFWQLDMLIAETAHVSGRIHAPTSYTQLPLIKTYLSELRPHLVVTSPAHARELHNMQTDTSCEMYVIAPIAEPVPTGPWSYLDLHVIPGISCAYQCPYLIAAGNGELHPTTGAQWSYVNSELSLTHPLLPSLGRIHGAGTLKNTSCTCGATTLLSYA